MGITLGTCYAGVVGKEDGKLLYDVWGKAINEAQIYKETADMSTIHCSKSIQKIFSPDYTMNKREGVITINDNEFPSFYIQGKRSGRNDVITFRYNELFYLFLMHRPPVNDTITLITQDKPVDLREADHSTISAVDHPTNAMNRYFLHFHSKETEAAYLHEHYAIFSFWRRIHILVCIFVFFFAGN